MKKLDYNEIKWSEWVYYDETSPTFLRWKVDRAGGAHKQLLVKKSGDIAGSFDFYGYSVIKLLGHTYKNHRIIWILFNERIDPKLQIDHIDGNVGNNHINNIRLVSRSVNNRNSAIQRNNTTGVTGVYPKIDHGGRRYYVADWRDLNGNRKHKSFSIDKLGEIEAFNLACEYRKNVITELNSKGAGYTERHGALGI